LLQTSSLTSQIVAAAAITSVFAAAARILRGVTRSGAVAGSLISFLLCVSAGIGAFALLLAVFLLSYGATKIGRSRKEILGTAERPEGRKASQVVANLGVAAVLAMLFRATQQPSLLLAMTAAFAEAASDTVSSEIGQASAKEPYLITTWKRVKPGTDGGITPMGTIAGALAAFVIGMLSATVKLIPWNWAALAAIAGIAGMLFDSVLGATLERSAVLDNDKVNFLGTMAAALLALLAKSVRF
jgi:uncharacterized protein (TIGR00297 family)